jgi:hypothetical protein
MYKRTCTYELPRKEQFLFANIARINKLRLSVHLMYTEHRVYKHLKKLTLTNIMIHLIKKNKFNLRTFNLETHFKVQIMFVCWGSPVVSEQFMIGVLYNAKNKDNTVLSMQNIVIHIMVR